MSNNKPASSNKPKRYIVHFEGNNSKRWDGKETWIEAEILDELYSEAELKHGAEIMVPWRSEGKITHWKGIFVDQNASTPAGICMSVCPIKVLSLYIMIINFIYNQI